MGKQVTREYKNTTHAPPPGCIRGGHPHHAVGGNYLKSQNSHPCPEVKRSHPPPCPTCQTRPNGELGTSTSAWQYEEASPSPFSCSVKIKHLKQKVYIRSRLSERHTKIPSIQLKIVRLMKKQEDL